MHHEKMKMCDDYTCKMKENSMHEWFNTTTGLHYKKKYDQLKSELDTLMGDIDSHVHEHMRQKFGHM